MNSTRIIIASLVIALTASCSVLDDRQKCPVKLSVSYDEKYGDGFFFLNGSDSLLYTGKIMEGQPPQTFSVPAGIVTYTAVFGLDGDDLRHDVYIVDAGCEPKEFHAFILRDMDVAAGLSEFSVRPCKQCCNLEVFLENTESRKLSCIIESTTCGMDLSYLNPCRGEYRVTKSPVDDRVDFTLLRQGFDDLKLRIKEERFGASLNVGTYSLTSLLDDFGYDWDAESLRDLRMTVKIGEEDVTLTYSP